MPFTIQSINKSLTDHELIKVRVKIGNKKIFAPIIEEKTFSTIVGSIGKILILYREAEDKEDSKIILP